MAIKQIKRLVKGVAPEFYDSTIKFLSSENVRKLRSWPRLRQENEQIRQNYPRFAIKLQGRMGMGAALTWSVGVLGYCEKQSLLPRIMFTSPLYASVPGEDWLGRYFERLGKMCPTADEAELPQEKYVKESVYITLRLRPVFSELSLQDAHDLFNKSLRFRSELLEEAAEFCRAKGIGPDTIAVHYRGTDKRLEATVTKWSDLADSVAACLALKKSNIFVATDEPEFLDFMRARFGAENVTDLDCQEIYSGRPAHIAAGNPDVKAREAIQTILVLSRCGVLIRTRSHLSSWAKILNPALPTIVFGEMLPGDQMRFPEHLIKTEVRFD